MAAIAIKLSHQGKVDVVEILFVDVVAPVIPFLQVQNLCFEVLDTVFTGSNGVVAQVFGLAAGVEAVAFTVAPPQTSVGTEAVDGDFAQQISVAL